MALIPIENEEVDDDVADFTVTVDSESIFFAVLKNITLYTNSPKRSTKLVTVITSDNKS